MVWASLSYRKLRSAFDYQGTLISHFTELKKGGNMGNEFLEPMSVFRNKLIRQYHNIKESLQLSNVNSKMDLLR
jgi:hypothetical protein